MSSITVSFTGNSSVLYADFVPELFLDSNSEYSCALLDFTSYNSIPNIVRGKNSVFHFKYTKDRTEFEKNISLETGAWEIDEILKYLKSQLALIKITLNYVINVSTSKIRLSFDTKIECINDSLLVAIGFSKEEHRVFNAGAKVWSDHLIKITDIDVIRVECDIISGSYINGQTCQTLYMFSSCTVSPGHKFQEVPRHIVYLPVKEKEIRTIRISIVDQKNRLIDFRGEQITCRIHIKKDN